MFIISDEYDTGGYRMNYRRELNSALKKLKDIEFALNESAIVAITDQKGIIQFVNDKFCEISKYKREELIGQDHRIVNSGYHDKEFMKNVWKTIGSGKIWRGEFRNKAKDGTFYWVDTTIVPFLNSNGKPYQYIAIRYDITEKKKIQKEMERMAYIDSLTGVPNRNSLNKYIRHYIKAKRKSQMAILFLDIDRFKSINDHYGHFVGDLLLEEVGTRLKACVPNEHTIFRQGGDEFIIILEDFKSQNDVESIAQSIVEELSKPYNISGRRILASTSIGVSISPKMNVTHENQLIIESLIKQADTAMYHAKRKGGNQYCFNTDKQMIELENYYKMEHELLKPSVMNEFYLVYQPIVQLKTNKIIGFEALIRWNNSKLGLVPPSEFIPILEDNGEIITVGEWVIKSACKQMKEWLENGLSLERISVNVSPVQFNHRSFVQEIIHILHETKLDPKYLELEITEGMLLNIDEALETLKELKKIGVHIAIDDFGTGYSSLYYLKHLPVDKMKIDQSFTRTLNKDGEIIVDTIIAMANNLNFIVTAEGIETDDQLNYLSTKKCDEGQGYYFSRPMLADEVVSFVKNYDRSYINN